ncbi:hypothetical protein KP509_21G084700 [Ceratopteris richardii]|nr:hypothetical protein KP509_21G084700 [Ceratopteris richardii]
MNKHNPITLDCLDEHTNANDSFSCDSVITKVHFEGAVDVADQVADTDPVQNIMSTKSHDDVMIAIQEDVHSTGSGDGDDLVFSTSGEDTKLRFSKRKANCIGNSASQNKRFMLKDSESKRSRAAEVHNRSERRRRERINEKLKILRDLIPHTDKTDKATLLEEAIEYLKALQAQIMVMSCMTGICVPPMLVTNGMVECFIPQDMVVEYRAGLVPNGAMISHLQSEQHVL